MDACVLIDVCQSDRSIITLVSQHLGEVHVATTVLAEVAQLDESEAVSLGIKLVEPSLEMAAEAAAARGVLSFNDRLCLLLAKQNRWTCVSNDRALRCECTSVGVPLMWGLEMVAVLVERGALPSASAREIGLAVFRSNRFLGRSVLQRFLLRIGGPGSLE